MKTKNTKKGVTLYLSAREQELIRLAVVSVVSELRNQIERFDFMDGGQDGLGKVEAENRANIAAMLAEYESLQPGLPFMGKTLW